MAKVDVVDPKTGEVLSQRELPYLDENGHEVLDPVPMEPPIGWFKQPSLIENVRNMVRNELSMRAHQQGFETFEEADDYDVGDDYDPSSPHENEFDPPVAELVEAGKKSLAEKAARKPKKPAPAPAEPLDTPSTDDETDSTPT